MTLEKDELDAQSYHLLRIADIVGSLGGYVSASRSIPSEERLQASTVFNFHKDSKRKMIRELRGISDKIQKDFKHIFELRQQFWHPESYSRTPEESRQNWQDLAATLPEEQLMSFRETIRESIDQMQSLRYGTKELTAKQRTQLEAIGLYRSMEALEILDTEIAKVQAVRMRTPSANAIRENALLYRRATVLVGSNSAERNNLAHRFYDNGNLRPEPFLTSTIRARFAMPEGQEQTDRLLFAELEEQLKAGMLLDGNLPDGVSEKLRIVQDTREAHAFQTYMEGLVYKMLPGWDFEKHPVRFFQSDTDEVNASILKSDHKPALVFFNKGLLKLVGNDENMLLHVLGHELGHGLFSDALGDLKVTKIEEAVVNLPNIQWMHENGIDPRGALRFARKTQALHAEARKELMDSMPEMSLQEVVALDTLITASDEHPNPAINAAVVNNTLTAYKQHVAGTYDNLKQLTIPKEMRDVFARAQHVSVLDRRIQNAKFDEMGGSGSLNLFAMN
jgi:hypothetical protein